MISSGILPVLATGHSVAQVQTTKFFAPETVALLKARALSGSPGFVVGDTVNYIVQFTPVANAATIGVNGYVTDYIPQGTQVIGASMVTPSGATYVDSAPELPGPSPDGWGSRTAGGQTWIAAPFNANTYDSLIKPGGTGLCAAAGKTNNCNGKLSEATADTGIFYSTDARTKLEVLPSVNGVAAQGTNGYLINPTGASQLNPIIGQVNATTHNQWDADQTQAFGTTTSAVASVAFPKVSAALRVSSVGFGSMPFNAGSGVAGPDVGYKLDNTGSIGPWQRIAYAGSRIGTNAAGPATATGASVVAGAATSAGYNLSSANPLPAATNAVRWAIGRLVVGENRYVKISLKLTAPVPGTGLVNNSEVFGGDSAAAAGQTSFDNQWRYHVPSVADNNSNLFLFKEVVKVNGVASDGQLIPANAKLRYRLTYLNTGNAPQTNVVLSDKLPTQTPANSVTAATVVSGPSILPFTPAAPAAGGATITFATIPSLPPGGTGIVEFDVQTNAALGAIVQNNSTLVSTALPSGVKSSFSSQVSNTAKLGISKTTSTPAIGPAGTATYTITIANTGNAAANNIVVRDILPTSGGANNAATRFNLVAGSSSFTGIAAVVPATVSPPTVVPYTADNRQQVTWTFPAATTLAAGASLTITFQAQAGASVPASDTAYSNDAIVTYNDGSVTTDDYATLSAPVKILKADLSLAKTASAGPYALNTNIDFTLTATNNGPTTALAPTIVDTLPAGLTFVSAAAGCTNLAGTVTCTLADLAASGTASVTITAKPTVLTNLTNTATISSTTNDPVAGNNTATATVNVPDADLLVTKTVSNGTPTINANVTFAVAVKNNGADTATNVSVADSLPAGLTLVSSTPSQGSYASGTWSVGSLTSGTTATLAIVAKVTSHTLITNTATATSDQYDPDATNNAASATVNVPDANLLVSKTVSNGTPAINSNVTFTVSVTDSGPDGATNVSVADAVPAGLTLVSSTPSQGSYASGTWTVGSLANGVTATLSIVAKVTSHVAITNSASASADQFDPNATNNAASATVNVPDADLQVTKTVDNPTPALNANVTFTVSVVNNGPDAAAGVSVADTLPAGLTLVSSTPSQGSYAAGTWTVGSLANGVSATLAVVAKVTTHTARINTATASSTTFDPTSSNDAASVTVNVPDADLQVTKTVDNPAPALNANVTFSVSVLNNGPDTAAGVSVADALPAGLTLVSSTPSQGSYAAGVWTVGSVANGVTVTLSIVAKVTTHTPVTNTATASTSTFDPTSGNDSASATVDVPNADLAVTKSVDTATPVLNANVTFTIGVTNTGPDTAGAVSIADLLPAGLTFVSSAPSIGSYNSGTGAWSVGTMANGASASLTIVAKVTSHTLLTNTATASSTTFDPASGNNAASATVNVPDADLQVTKTVDNTTPALNANVTFTIGVTNTGPDTAQAVSVADLLPAGLTVVSSTPSIGSYNSGTGAWSIGSMTNGAAASLTIVATVTDHTILTNTATASSTTFDPASGNNAASATVNVPDADLQVTKTVDNATPALNGNVTFTVSVLNAGPDTAANVSVADVLPAGMTLVSSTPSQGSYSAGAWSVGSVANGVTATLAIVAKATVHTLLTNTATASSSTFDPNPANDSASATVNVPDANLAVTKTVDNATPALNANVTFTIGVTNNGPDTSVAVTVADTLPAGLTLVSSSTVTGSYASGVWTVGNLANGASASLAIVAKVTTHTLVTNTASVSSNTYDPAPGNDSASATVNVPDADLQVAKIVDDPQPNVSDNVTFTVTTVNNGPDTATGVSVADALPAGLTLISATPGTGSYAAGVWTVGTLANGANATLSILARVTASGTIVNTATATATQYDPVAGNNSASASIGAVEADLAVTKTVDNASPVLGANVTFTVTLTNNGPNAATGVSVADALPAGLTLVSATPSAGAYAGGAWTLGTVANGAAPSLQIVATVTTLAPVTNTATATATTFDPTGANDSASAVIDVPNADVAVTKTVDNATPAYGANVTFTVSVTNNGPDAATGVTVTDTLPAGLTLVSATPSAGTYAGGAWTIGTIANGITRSLTIVAQVVTPASVTNTATVAATTADQTAGNDAASVSVDALDADLAVTKTVDNPAPALGANVTFTVTVTNNGPNTAAAVQVTDALPVGLTLVSASPSVGSYASGVWTVGNVANGVSRTLTIVATAAAHTALTNTATVGSSTFDPAGGNNSASATVDVPDANLALTKTVDNATPAINGNVTFTVTVTNNGPDTASAVTVADALPAGLTLVSSSPSVGTYASGTWSVGNLANAASATLTVVARVTADTSITNTATATSSTFDPSAGDNTAAAVVDVPDADLEITKTVDTATPAINGNVTFTVTVTNLGPDPASGVTVLDALPAGLTLVSATPSSGLYSSLTGTWTVGSLANGAAPTLTVVATVTTRTAVTNTATVASPTFDPVSANNAASVTVDVPDADLAVAKSVDIAAPSIGSNVVFTVSVTNNGPDAASAVTVADALPGGLTFVSANPSAGTFAAGVWNVGNIPNGATRTLQLTATVTVNTPVTNTATATSATLDPTPGNDAASVTVDVPEADLAVTKTVDTAAPVLGANVTFTVTLTNNGPNTANGVAVSDALPAGLTLVGSTPSTGAYAAGVWTVGNMPSGAVETLAVVARVTNDASITNTATATSSTFDPTPGNNTASAAVDVPNADLAVTKSVDTATPSLGGNVTFTVAVVNHGPDAAAAVTVADVLPTGLTLVSATPSAGSYAAGIWTIGALANGATRTLTIVATVTDHVAITNTATATTTTRDTVPGNDGASATVNVPDADLAVVNTVDVATPAVGANVTYTVTITNNGPVAATGVTVADALPSGLTLVSSSATAGTYASGAWAVGGLSAGASETLTIVATVTIHTPATTTATVSGAQFDPIAANNSDAVVVDARDADLAITKTVDDPNPEVGGNVTFTVTATNGGPDTAAAVTVADALPAGLTLVSAAPSVGTYAAGVWAVGSLTSGASATLSVTARVTVATTITNTATGSTATFDPNSADNAASASVDARNADVSVTKTVSDTSPAFGSNVTFTVTVANAGPDAAANVHVADVLPAGLTFVGSASTAGTYAAGDWNVGALANGASATLTIVATVTDYLPAVNTATVTSDTQDPNATNDSAAATVDVPDANLLVNKTVSDSSPAINANVTFVVTVTNNGPDAAAAVTVADALPAGLAFQSATASVGTYSGGTWTVGTLANGQVETLTVVAKVTAVAPQINAATATSTTYDPALGNNTALASVDVIDVDLVVANTVDNPAPEVGDTVTFTVTLLNNGPTNATGVHVAYPLPAGLTLVGATPSVGTYSGGVWTIGNLMDDATATMTLTATVGVNTPLATTATASGDQYDPTPADNVATASLDAREADISVTKVVDNPNPPLNANVTFTVTVHNNGPDTSSGVTVADTLPAGLTPVSSSASAGSYAAGVWTVGSLVNGATATLTITATVTSPASITNTATVSATTFDPVAANNSSFATLGAQQADVAVTKTVDNATPALGGNVTFTVTAANNGPDAAAAVSVADALPGGLALVSATPSLGSYAAGTWTIGTLANGQTATLVVVATVTTNVAVTNTATASTTTFDANGANDSASVSVNAPDADLAVTKTVDNATPAANGTVTFTVTLTNNGPNAAPAVHVADALPAGLTLTSATATAGAYAGGDWSLGTVANGATETLTVVATVGSSAPMTNTATATSGAFDANPANDTGSASVDVADADLAITKTVDDPAPAINATVVFTVTVTNNGPDAAPGTRVADALPAGLTMLSATPSAGTFAAGVWTIGTMANGATEALTVTARVTSSAPITNSATVTSRAADPATGNDSASAGVDVPDADLVVTKTVSDATPALNANVTFTVTVTNSGPQPAAGVTVADTLPAGLSLVSSTPSVGSYTGGTWIIGGLASGASETLDVVATVTSPATITNTATASSVSYDGTPANNSDSASVDVPQADLAITKTVSNAAPALNGNVTFTLTVTNNGPSAASAVSVSDVLPAGLTFVSASSPSYVGNTWTIGSLANGAQATLDIVAQVTSPVAITNTATVSSSTLDANATNDSDAVVVDVPQADLTLTKTVDDATPNEGQDVTYTLSLTNNGPDAASAVDVTDVLPAGLTFVSAAPSAGTFAAGIWSLASVPSGATRTLDIVATVTAQGPIVNNAEVTASGTFDPTSTPGDAIGDDAASVTVTALPPSADLSLTAGASAPNPTIGGTVTYTLTVTNNGPSATDGVSVTDLLPAGVTYGSSSATRGSYDAGSGTWTIGALASGQSVTLSIVVTIDQAGLISNSAEIGSSNVPDPDSAPANGNGSEDDQAVVAINAQTAAVTTSADLTIVKSASQQVAKVGDIISYAIVVTNHGPDAATNVQVLEQLPSALQFVSARTSTGAYDVATFVWSIPSIPNGGAASLIVTTLVVAPGSVTNAVQVLAADQPDPDGPFNLIPGAPGGAQARATISVSGPTPAPTRLAITKGGTKVVKAGGTVRFTIRIKNNGTVPATNVVVTDCIPTGLSLRRGLRTGELRKNGRIGWQVGTLQPGQTRVVRVVLRADRDARGVRRCAAVATAANAASVRAVAGVRVVAGAAVSDRARVTG